MMRFIAQNSRTPSPEEAETQRSHSQEDQLPVGWIMEAPDDVVVPVRDISDTSSSTKEHAVNRDSTDKSTSHLKTVFQEPPEKEEEEIASNPSICSNIRVNTRQTVAINVLRAMVLLLLTVTATIVCVGVHLYTQDIHVQSYEQAYQHQAQRVLEAFQDTIQNKLSAIAALSTQLTSYSHYSNSTFPFVTLPDFAVRGSDLRVLSDAMIVHWMPLVTDKTREAWEDYALQHRSQIDQAFAEDAALRQQQDQDYGHFDQEGNRRQLENVTETILQDGTGYHAKIWSIGAKTPRGDEANGTGPYLPLWQRSPVSVARQSNLNLNFASAHALYGVLPEMTRDTPKAVMNKFAFPLPAAKTMIQQNLAVGLFRHSVSNVIDDPQTFIAYPVLKGFDYQNSAGNSSSMDRLGGVLAVNMYWKTLFQNIVPDEADDPEEQDPQQSLLCVLSNSFNQTITYLIDGSNITYLGAGDFHLDEFDYLRVVASVNEFVEQTAGPTTRAYTAVPLSKNYGKYNLTIYPATGPPPTNLPMIYTVIVAMTFLFTTMVYVLFAWYVERRQQQTQSVAIDNAKKAAQAERELNEFLAHEVRNPLAAAISACSFVHASLTEEQSSHLIVDAQFQQSLQEDVQIIGSSLRFINDFLRSMLDIHRANGQQLEIQLQPTDLLKDVLEPVANMFYVRESDVEIHVDCSSEESLVVATDALRLKQVLLNLGRNASKFVTQGFIRFCVGVTESGLVELSVEDSGPGIPLSKRAHLFDKFQTSLDNLSQGTGIGLSLCKSLVELLQGEIYLDQAYDSGVDGCPGARFVIALNTFPIQLLDNSDAAPETDIEDFQDDPATKQQGNDDFSDVDEEVGLACASGSPSIKGKPEEPSLPEALSVLFVDDDLMLRKLFARGIEKVAPNWKIQEASNGETALRMADTQTFDLIFMDQYMASTERQLLGTETVRALRARGVSKERTVICGLSANGMQDQFLNAGANGFLMKPIPCQPTVLRQELQKLLSTLQEAQGDGEDSAT